MKRLILPLAVLLTASFVADAAYGCRLFRRRRARRSCCTQCVPCYRTYKAVKTPVQREVPPDPTQKAD